MAKIIQMSQTLTNLIAAGEVIERPSNVIKELVENSIDAGAKHISIYVLEGGIKEIKIIDDGTGMDKEDVELCFLPHATSKIKTEYDLPRIKTLGFRGEAISSIQSISKMEIASKMKDSKQGYSVTYKFNKRQEGKVVTITDGTTITVSNLFYNTPVRLKYLKTPEKELASINYLLSRMALTHPDISFSLYSDNKLILKTNGDKNMISLFGVLYNLDVAKKLCHQDFNFPGYSGDIYYAKPEIYRSNKLQITLVINGRYIKNNTLSDYIIKAFDGFLPIGKYPVITLYLTIDPMLIDVNIHPKKAEIKIVDDNIVGKNIYNIIKDSLENIIQIPEIKLVENPKNITDNIDYLDRVKESNKLSFSEDNNEIDLFNNSFKEKNVDEDIVHKDEEKVAIIKKLPELYYVGIIAKTYIICQNNLGIYIIDQHAAMERIKYEYFIEKMSSLNQPVTNLLVPLKLEMTQTEKIYLEEHLKEFAKIGFEFKIESEVLITGAPLWVMEKDIDDIIKGLLDEMIKTNQVDIRPFRDKIAKQISCKSSIRANDKITEAEAIDLLKQLEKCQNPYHCPHGRPTLIQITFKELEKLFERIQS